MSKEENLKVIAPYADCFRKWDKEGFMAAFTDDAVWTDPVGTPPAEGSEAISRMYDAFKEMLSVCDITPKTTVSEGNVVMVEQVAKLVSQSGKVAWNPGVATYVLENGKIKRLSVYYDLGNVQKQHA